MKKLINKVNNLLGRLRYLVISQTIWNKKMDSGSLKNARDI